MTPIEENKSTAELQLRMAQEVLVFIRQHPLRKDIGNSDAEAKVLMLAQVAATGVRNSLAMLGVYP